MRTRIKRFAFERVRVLHQKEEDAMRRPLLFGGDDGNRTRVQKPLDVTFSVGSRLFMLPARVRQAAGLPVR